DQIERAKVICRRCDVTAQCLEWSLKTNQDAGVWGGLYEDERRTLRRRRQRRHGIELNRQNIVAQVGRTGARA
ncbi:MAG: WhiB family transcriptional regulator, partial [Egibacteraceae bacterium]